MIEREKNIPKLLGKIVYEVMIVLALYFTGEGLVYLLGTKFPGSVVGMLLLLAGLHLKWVKVDDIRYVSSFLLGYMPLFFIPAGISVMVSYTLMEGFYLQIIALILISTMLVMVLTGHLVQYLVEREKQ